MAKRKDTIALEQLLTKETREKRLYGCEEVTIGFYNKGMGDEHVDYMTMDSKGIIKCYEIKVTMEDLKSSAKKSFYGHYNYLVVTENLYNKIIKADLDLTLYGISNEVGIMIADVKEDGIISRFTSLYSVRKARKQVLSVTDETMLKESLIRSMFYKMDKYRSNYDGTTISKLKKDLSYYKKEYENVSKRYKYTSNMIYGIGGILYIKYGVRFKAYVDYTSEQWADTIIKFINELKSKKLI